VADRKAVIAAGLGCRAGCGVEDVLAALQQALDASGRTLAEVQALYAPEFKRDEPGLQQAAARAGKPLCLLPLAALRAHNAAALTRSEHTLQRFGVCSVAETAALAGAQQLAAGPRLLAARARAGGATCALAITHAPA
jgi:cobalt-precorrin 5A hydrolase